MGIPKLKELKPSSYDIAYAQLGTHKTLGAPIAGALVGYGIGKGLEKALKRKGFSLGAALAGATLGDVLIDVTAEYKSSQVRPAQLKAVRQRLGRSKMMKALLAAEQISQVAEGVVPFGWLIAENTGNKKLSKILTATEIGLLGGRTLMRGLLMNRLVNKALNAAKKSKKNSSKGTGIRLSPQVRRSV